MKLAQPTKLLSVAFLVIFFVTIRFSPSDPINILFNLFPPQVEEAPPPQTGGQSAEAPVVFAEIPVQVTPELQLEPETSAPEEASQSLDPEFQAFIDANLGDQANVIRGIYVQDVLALPVIQQPETDSTFVSPDYGVITQFQSAAAFGVTGLLAHNYLSGLDFYNLSVGDIVQVVYGDGSFQEYQIESESQFQKLTPESLHSDFVDLETGETLPTEQVFSRFYRDQGSLTFQTCLERNGVSNWGLTFWKATPID